MVVDDGEVVIIRRKIVTTHMPNIIDDSAEVKVILNHYHAFISLINIVLVLFTSIIISFFVVFLL